jgi:putative endonuclease
MTGFVYILASQKNGTLYVGVTADIPRRMHEHRSGLTPGFASKYGALRLVWYEEHFDFRDAVKREKAIKSWNRQWKIDLIEKENPEWNELFKGLWW